MSAPLCTVTVPLIDQEQAAQTAGVVHVYPANGPQLRTVDGAVVIWTRETYTADGTGTVTLALPQGSYFDPPAQFVIQLPGPNGGKWSGVVPSVAGPLTLETLKNSWGWGLVSGGVIVSTVTGPPGMVNRGTYDAAGTYAINDAVSYDGSYYMALTINGPQNGGAVTPGTNGAVWQLMAAAGAIATNQSPNLVYAGPASGSQAAPVFRGLVPADLPVASVVTPGALRKTWVNIHEYEGVAGWDGTANTDLVPALAQALIDLQTAGGGTIYLPNLSYLWASKLVLPFVVGSQSYGTSPTIRLTGNGRMDFNALTFTGTTINCTYSNGPDDAKLAGIGRGSFEIDHLALRSTVSGDETSFIWLTGTSGSIHHVSFIGANPGKGNATGNMLFLGQFPTIDAITLGGTQATPGTTLDNGFYGYTTTITECLFSGIQRLVNPQAIANSWTAYNNFASSDCGNKTSMWGAAIDLETGVANSGHQVTIRDNGIEMYGYNTAVRIGALSGNNHIAGNGVWDSINSVIVQDDIPAPTTLSQAAGAGDRTVHLQGYVPAGTWLALQNDTSGALAATITRGDASCTLAADPATVGIGVGALVQVQDVDASGNPLPGNYETFRVTAVAASAPWTVTFERPAAFTHAYVSAHPAAVLGLELVRTDGEPAPAYSSLYSQTGGSFTSAAAGNATVKPKMDTTGVAAGAGLVLQVVDGSGNPVYKGSEWFTVTGVSSPGTSSTLNLDHAIWLSKTATATSVLIGPFTTTLTAPLIQAHSSLTAPVSVASYVVDRYYPTTAELPTWHFSLDYNQQAEVYRVQAYAPTATATATGIGTTVVNGKTVSTLTFDSLSAGLALSTYLRVGTIYGVDQELVQATAISGAVVTLDRLLTYSHTTPPVQIGPWTVQTSPGFQHGHMAHFLARQQAAGVIIDTGSTGNNILIEGAVTQFGVLDLDAKNLIANGGYARNNVVSSNPGDWFQAAGLLYAPGGVATRTNAGKPSDRIFAVASHYNVYPPDGTLVQDVTNNNLNVKTNGIYQPVANTTNANVTMSGDTAVAGPALALTQGMVGGSGLLVSALAGATTADVVAQFAGKDALAGLSVLADGSATARVADSITAAITPALVLGHKTSGTPTTGFGSGIKFQAYDNLAGAPNGPGVDQGLIGSIWTNAADGSQTSAMLVKTVNNGAALAEVARFTGAGLLALRSTSTNKAATFYAAGMAGDTLGAAYVGLDDPTYNRVALTAISGTSTAVQAQSRIGITISALQTGDATGLGNIPGAAINVRRDAKLDGAAIAGTSASLLILTDDPDTATNNGGVPRLAALTNYLIRARIGDGTGTGIYTDKFAVNRAGALAFDTGSGLGFGTAGQVLQSGGSGAAPSWGSVSAAQIASVNPSALTGAGTVPVAALAGITGTQLSATAAIAAGQIASVSAGTLVGPHMLPDGVLSSNVPLLNVANAFTNTVTATGLLNAGQYKSTATGTPTAAIDAAQTVTGTVAVIGNDHRGDVDLTGTTGTIAAGALLDVSFSQGYSSAPAAVIITPYAFGNSARVQPYVSAKSTTGFTIAANAAGSATSSAKFSYWCIW